MSTGGDLSDAKVKVPPQNFQQPVGADGDHTRVFPFVIHYDLGTGIYLRVMMIIERERKKNFGPPTSSKTNLSLFVL
jgi:hypothetical protein